MHKPCNQVLHVALSQDPSCYANALLEDLLFNGNYVHGHMVAILILANFHAMTKIIIAKINFHLKSGLFTKFLCYKNLELAN